MTLATLLDATGLSGVPVLLFIKVTCLLLGALGISYVMMRASSGARHLVWLVVLSALLVLPVVALWSPLRLEVLPSAFSTSVDARSSANAAVNNSYAYAPTGGVSSGTNGGVSSGTSRGVGSSYRNGSSTGGTRGELLSTPSPVSNAVSFVRSLTATIGGSLLALWAIVSAALLGWLAFGAYSVRRIVRRATPLQDAEWQTPLYEIADRFRLTDAPRLVRSEDVKMPFACGVLHSTIVLPAEADSWSADRRSAVLLHELGHVQRRDLIGHTLGRVACALYWFHPLVWTAARRLRAESERACDDLALSCGARPSDYAEHLLDIVTCVRDHATPSIALAMAHRKEFEGRMLAILNPELERKRPSKTQSVALVGTLAVMCVIVGAAAPVADARTTPVHDQQVAQDSMNNSRGRNDGRFSKSSAQVETQVQNTTQSTVRSTITSGSPMPFATPDPLANPSLITSSAINKLALDGARTGIAIADQMIQRALGGKNASQLSGAGLRIGASVSADERPALLARVLTTDTSSELRRIAAWGLHEYSEEPVAVNALVSALERDANVAVREMAAWSLADFGDEAKVNDALINSAKRETDASVRSTVIWALGDRGDDKSLDVLVSALSSNDASVRELAAWGIGTVSPQHAPAKLMTALSDHSADVRLSAAWALFTIEDPAAVADLEAQMRKETDKNVQVAIVRALAATGEQSVDALKSLIDSKDQDVRASAIRALAGLHSIAPWPWPRPRPRPYP